MSDEKAKEKIKELCQSRGISMRKLEESLGFGNGSIAKTISFRTERLQAIADYFGVPISYFMESDPIKEKNAALEKAFNERPEMRALFSVAEKATKEDIEQAIKIIEALKK